MAGVGPAVGEGVLHDPGVAGRVGVVDVELAAVGGERQPEQSLLAPGRHPAGEVEDGGGVEGTVSDGPHPSDLLDEIEGSVAGADGQGDGLGEARHLGQRHHHRPERLGLRGGGRRGGGSAPVPVVPVVSGPAGVVDVAAPPSADCDASSSPQATPITAMADTANVARRRIMILRGYRRQGPSRAPTAAERRLAPHNGTLAGPPGRWRRRRGPDH